MEPHTAQSVSSLLDQLSEDREGAFSDLVDRVYDELRRVAERQMGDHFKRPIDGLTLSPTAIVNDAVIQLMNQRQMPDNREQFFAIATRLMFRLIADYSRRRMAQKRGGGRRGDALDAIGAEPAAHARSDTLDRQAVFRAIEELHEAYPRKAEVVTLHVVCNKPLSAVAEAVGMSQRNVERDWAFARAWLRSRLDGRSAEPNDEAP